jgi:hypothetical protein
MMRAIGMFLMFPIFTIGTFCASYSTDLTDRFTFSPNHIDENFNRPSLPWYEIPLEVFFPSKDLDLNKLLSACQIEKNVSEKIRFLKEQEAAQNYKFKLIVIDRINAKPVDLYIEYKFNGTTIRQRFVRGTEYCRGLITYLFNKSKNSAQRKEEIEITKENNLREKYK